MVNDRSCDHVNRINAIAMRYFTGKFGLQSVFISLTSGVVVVVCVRLGVFAGRPIYYKMCTCECQLIHINSINTTVGNIFHDLDRILARIPLPGCC